MKTYPILFQRCLLMLGFKLVHLFEKFDVQYITCGGTLLGQIRGKQLIKHDYDLDYEVPTCSRKALFEVVKFVKENPMYGLRVELRLPHMVKFVPLMAKTLAAEIKFDRPDVPNPTADVFFGEARPGGGQQLVGNVWKNWYYLPGEIHPIVKREFSGHMWDSPHNATSILRRYYGKDFMVPKFYPWPNNVPSDKCGQRSGGTSSRTKTKTR